MSRTASRSAALLAPLPQVVPAMTSNGDAAAVTLASADATATVATPATAPASVGEVASAAATASLARDARNPATSAATAATTAQAVAIEPAAKNTAATQGTAFAGPKTATVAQIGKPAAMPHSPSAAGSIGSAVVALAMVIGLILALAWIAKRMPGLRGGAGSNALRIVGSLALSPRERLVVVAVGETQLVLGVGAAGTRTLHTLSEPLPVAQAAAPSAFAQVLAQHFGKKA
jgi:flagellar protein FliO/FliZ